MKTKQAKKKAKKKTAPKRKVAAKRTRRKTKQTHPHKRGPGRPLKGQEGWWIEPFLEKLERTYHIKTACQLVGCSVSTVRDRREKDPEFNKRLEAARAEAIEYGDFCAYQRGTIGWKEPKTIAGEREEITRWSDTCLLAFLNAHHELYHHRLDIKARLESSLEIDLSNLDASSDDELDSVYERLIHAPAEN